MCLRSARAGDFDCMLLAGRYTLLEQGALAELLPFCESRGAGIALGGPFTPGLLPGAGAERRPSGESRGGGSVLGGPFNSGILAGPVREGAWHDYAPAPPALLDRPPRSRAVCPPPPAPLPAVAPGSTRDCAAAPVARAAWPARAPAPPALLDRARRIEAVCSRHGVPLPAAALPFPLAHPAAARGLPGAPGGAGG